MYVCKDSAAPAHARTRAHNRPTVFSISEKVKVLLFSRLTQTHFTLLHYGARARAGGTCLVAVFHAASIIRCGGGASGAVRRLAAPVAHPQHPMTLAA